MSSPPSCKNNTPCLYPLITDISSLRIELHIDDTNVCEVNSTHTSSICEIKLGSKERRRVPLTQQQADLLKRNPTGTLGSSLLDSLVGVIVVMKDEREVGRVR
jgi:hypothetical protein